MAKVPGESPDDTLIEKLAEGTYVSPVPLHLPR
jgi:hypothetical protein